MHGLKSAILAILRKIGQLARLTMLGCISFYQSSINLNYHQKLCLVFCHSDPDPSSVMWKRFFDVKKSQQAFKSVFLDVFLRKDNFRI